MRVTPKPTFRPAAGYSEADVSARRFGPTFRLAAIVPDICLWVLLCAMVKFRPCCVAYFGHIQSMLPCSLLAKPEFPSLPFAKTSITLPGIFLRTFHDRCRRSARTRLRGSFFCLKPLFAIPAASRRCGLLRSRRSGQVRVTPKPTFRFGPPFRLDVPPAVA